ncbi:hypothetical protein ABT275_32185 [Streptomyces sp. NPDC001185]|uniref:hypothetical protein n=1 Tax=Streptomyces sp. NPDC001185 TaxID=3154380 RepID=UPI00332C9FA1
MTPHTGLDQPTWRQAGHHRIQRTTSSPTLLTNKLIRCGIYASVREVNGDISAWIDLLSDDRMPFTWIVAAGEILKSFPDQLTKVTPPKTIKKT